MNQSKWLPYILEILLKLKVNEILIWEEFDIVISCYEEEKKFSILEFRIV